MKYVAFLRGIMPTNPNMRGEKLRGVFERLGFGNVKTVITSGNVIFESSSSDVKKLEEMIEEALPKDLGFTSTTIIRSQDQLQNLVDQDPFKGKEHSRELYLTVTFFKNGQSEMFNSWDVAKIRGTEFMAKLEKEHGKEITTRTWKTILRILKAMQ